MFQDILRESPIYQEIVEQGREEERQQELQRQRQTLMGFVQRHFPEIGALAKQQIDSVTDPEILQTVILRALTEIKVPTPVVGWYSSNRHERALS